VPVSAQHQQEGCLFVWLRAQREHHDDLIRDFVTPVVSRLRDAPELDSLFFVRFDVPAWHLRFRVLGRPGWIDGPARLAVEEALQVVAGRDVVEDHGHAEYEREVERYGGVDGVALAERIFLHDTLACLDRMSAERDGRTARSRREHHLLLTERLLDLAGLVSGPRLAFYETAYRWALETDTWTASDLKRLDERYRSLEPGLTELVDARSSDADATWGGPETARIARRFLGAVRPVVEEIVEGCSVGRIAQEPVPLLVSYAHMSANRMGIDPLAEAILRYFMHRLWAGRIAS
jgi:thiopeptide-type bacteriocin biosynthesis protein